MSQPAKKELQIFNPSTNKMVSIKTATGRKLKSLRESGITAVSSADAMTSFIRSLAPDLSDEEIKAKYAELNEAQKYALEGMIPPKWTETKVQINKPPRRITASKLYYEKRRPEILAGLDVGDTLTSKELKEIVSNEWKKLSVKSGHNDPVFIEFVNMAKIANQDCEARVEEYRKATAGVHRPLSAKDIKKMEDNPGQYEINPLTGRPNKIKKDRREKKVANDIKHLVYDGEDLS